LSLQSVPSASDPATVPQLQRAKDKYITLKKKQSGKWIGKECEKSPAGGPCTPLWS